MCWYEVHKHAKVVGKAIGKLPFLKLYELIMLYMYPAFVGWWYEFDGDILKLNRVMAVCASLGIHMALFFQRLSEAFLDCASCCLQQGEKEEDSISSEDGNQYGDDNESNDSRQTIIETHEGEPPESELEEVELAENIT